MRGRKSKLSQEGGFQAAEVLSFRTGRQCRQQTGMSGQREAYFFCRRGPTADSPVKARRLFPLGRAVYTPKSSRASVSLVGPWFSSVLSLFFYFSGREPDGVACQFLGRGRIVKHSKGYYYISSDEKHILVLVVASVEIPRRLEIEDERGEASLIWQN